MRWIGMMMAAALLAGPAAAASDTMPGWLSGCWVDESLPNWTEECWTTTRGGQMMGSGRNGRGDAIRSWEVMQIERDARGVPVFYGSPKGRMRTAFPMVSSGERDIVFANPRHDYPQQIRYWREGTDLLAEVSLADGSKARRWHYRRQSG